MALNQRVKISGKVPGVTAPVVVTVRVTHSSGAPPSTSTRSFTAQTQADGSFDVYDVLTEFGSHTYIAKSGATASVPVTITLEEPKITLLVTKA